MTENHDHSRSIEELKRLLRLYFPEETVNAIERSGNWNDAGFRDKISKVIESQRQGLLADTTVNGWLKKPIPPIQWDIEQLMAQGTTLAIAGNTGIGKSWETMHLAYQFRLGGKWHGLPCRQLMPICVNLELTDNQMLTRIRKLDMTYPKEQYPQVKQIPFVAAKGEDYRLNSLPGKDKLLQRLRSYGMEFGLIILDPLALFIKGKLEKVDWNNEVEPVLNEIKREFGCSIILNHNFRKQIQIQGHTEDLFAPDRLKGVAEIMDRADNIVVFISESQPRNNPDGKSVRIEIAKWIHAAKTRDAEVELQPHRVKWDYGRGMFVPEDRLGWLPYENLKDTSV